MDKKKFETATELKKRIFLLMQEHYFRAWKVKTLITAGMEEGFKRLLSDYGVSELDTETLFALAYDYAKDRHFGTSAYV